MALQSSGRAAQANVFMNQPIFELACSTTEEAQLGIGIEAPVANPAAEEEILAGNPEAGGLRICRESCLDLVAERRLDLFVGIEREHPATAGLPQRKVLLRREAAPLFHVEHGVERFGNLARAVGRA